MHTPFPVRLPTSDGAARATRHPQLIPYLRSHLLADASQLGTPIQRVGCYRSGQAISASGVQDGAGDGQRTRTGIDSNETQGTIVRINRVQSCLP